MVVYVVKFLAESGLTLRDSSDIYGRADNLGILESRISYLLGYSFWTVLLPDDIFVYIYVYFIWLADTYFLTFLSFSIYQVVPSRNI